MTQSPDELPPPNLPMSATEAQASLDRAARPRTGTVHDRQVHASAVAMLGLWVGAFVAISRAFDERGLPQAVLTIVFLLGLGAAIYGPFRVARSTPRSAGVASMIGMVGCIFTWLAAVSALNYLHRDGSLTTTVELVALAALTSLPALIAGAIIRWKL